MNAASAVTKADLSGRIVLSPPSKTGDGAFKFLTWSMAMMVFVLVVVVGWELFQGSGPSLRKFGFGFLIHSDWDPVNNDFGALPFIFGTFVSSLVGLAIALPLSLATAVYSDRTGSVVDPSCGHFVNRNAGRHSKRDPWIVGNLCHGSLASRPREGMPGDLYHPFPLLKKLFGFLPLFQGPIYGLSVLSAAIIIAIMIVPIITSISREVFRAVPRFAARGRICAGSHALGGHAAGRAQVLQTRHFRRGNAGSWSRLGGNDGGDNGDRKPARYFGIPSGSRLHAGQRDRE